MTGTLHDEEIKSSLDIAILKENASPMDTMCKNGQSGKLK